MKRHITTLYFVIVILPMAINAQIGCPGCVVSLPDGLSADTFFLEDIPPAQVGVYYEQDVSFRLPKSTNSVSNIEAGIIPGLNIDEINIIAIKDLPAGLSWEASQTSFKLADETDGCIRLCGTPLEADTFTVSVDMEARIAIIKSMVTYDLDMEVVPATQENEGFALSNSLGCGELSVSFQNKIPSEGRPGYSYEWDFGNGNRSTLEDPPAQSYTEPGIYTIDYTATIDTVGYILTGVVIEAVRCDDLFSGPDLFIKIFNESNEIIYQTVHINNTPLPVNFAPNIKLSAANYTLAVLDEDDGLAGGDDLCANIIFNRESNGSYSTGDWALKLEVIHPVTTINTSDTVQVYENPEIPLISQRGPSDFCQGDSLQMISSYAAGNQWYKDGNALGNGIDTALVAHESGAYWVSYTSPDGCVAKSETVHITVYDTPEQPVMTFQGSLDFCPGDTVTFTSSYEGGNQWYRDSQPIPGELGRSLAATTPGVYSVLYTSPEGCSIQSGSRTVTVYEAPATPQISSSGPLNLCTGETVTLTSSSEQGNQWYANGTAIDGATDSVFDATGAGQYQVSSISADGCISFSDPVEVLVRAGPQEPVFENINNVLELSEAVLLPENYTYQWLFMDGVVGDPNNPLCAVEDGTYTLLLTDETTGCSSSSTQQVTIDPAIDCTVAVEEIDASAIGLKIFPNPFSELLQIRFNLATTTEVRLRMFDLLGRQHREVVENAAIGTMDYIWNLSQLPSGFYLVDLQLDDRRVVKRIVKQ